MSLTRVQPPAPSLEPVVMDHAELRSVLGFCPSGIAASRAAVDAEPVGLVATSEAMAMAITVIDAVAPRVDHRSTIHRVSTPSHARCLS